MTRTGTETYCPLCGTQTYPWQEDEFEIVAGHCPECSLELLDWTGDYEAAVELAESY